MIYYKNLTVIPSYHSNLDFVHEVRQAFHSKIPDVIAVEFPQNLKTKILQGVDRLPKISIIVYFDQFLKTQLFIPIDGTDSLIEAVRLSQEYGIPCEFIDLFVKNYNPEIFSMPDSYALNHLSLEEFYELIYNKVQFDYKLNLEKTQKEKIKKELSVGKDAEAWLEEPEEIDEFRDQYMAYRLKELMETSENILLVIGMKHWARIRYILDNKTHIEEMVSFEPDIDATLFSVLEKDLPKIMIETPNILFQFEIFRKHQKQILDDFNAQKKRYEIIKFDPFYAIKIIFKRAASIYEEEYKEAINLHKIKSIGQYLRNLPIIDGMIRPQLFDIVLAAKSIVNDDFAWIVWEECKNYPDAKDDWDLDPLNFTDQGIILNGKYFKIRRHVPVKIRKIKLPLKPKPEEKNKGEWKREWDKNSWRMVSHIPEDLFEENYFQHVRLRSKNILKDQMYRVHEFKSSLMDGIDFRETIKQWTYSNQKIFVKEQRKMKGDIDTVVIIFDEDKNKKPREEKFPNRMMWYAEHHNESDLAFYSTFPGEIIIGPGISRIELGGVASFFPPRGIPDIWDDVFISKYPFIKNKFERLLLASIVYAQKKYITYVANKPPRSELKALAKKLGNIIIYIPLDKFNPVSRRALRNIHVLAGRSVRDYAHKYIKKRRY